jgi:PIN domain nuclease of toxin-antitoxin system
LAILDPEDALHAAAVRAVRQIRDDAIQFVLPATAFAEVLVGVARQGASELADRRRQVIAAFGGPHPIDDPIAVAAARLRAKHRSLRLPDALILAVGEVLAAQSVLTGDKKWRGIQPNVKVVGR